MGWKPHTNQDDPAVHSIRSEVIGKKKFLYKIYEEWYGLIQKNLPSEGGPILELGSGAGLIRDFIPAAVTSDIVFLPYVDLILDGRTLPFGSEQIGCLVLINTFHHIPDVNRFLHEAIRVVRPGGRVLMIEPWITPWSGWIYRNFHHELIDMAIENWAFQTRGPMSGSNQALPSIVFERDLPDFERKCPQLKLEMVQPIMPLAYLLSGGFSTRLSAPSFSYDLIRRFEKSIFKQSRASMFALIVLQKAA